MNPRRLGQMPRVNPQDPRSALTMDMLGRTGDYPSCLPEAPYPPGQGSYNTSEADQAARWLGLPPPFYHTEIQVGLQATLTASAVRQEIAAFRVHQQHIAVIAYIGNGVENTSDQPFITWAFTVDGSDIPGYTNMIGLLSFGTLSPVPVRLAFRAGQRIAWVASNALAVPILNVSAMFRGWMWSPGIWEIGAQAPAPVME